LAIPAAQRLSSALQPNQSFKIVATDFSPTMIEALKAHVSEAGLTQFVESLVMDGQHLQDLTDQSFDLAYSMFGLMMFTDLQRGLREMLRVLKPK
jgi:ubiquinone/menaquinone biosynthesis C-methylase UbiE